MTPGDLSTVLVWGAATALTIALVAYAGQLAQVAERAARPRQSVAASSPAVVRDRVLVGTDGAPVAAGGPAVATAPDDGWRDVGEHAGQGAAGGTGPTASARARGVARSTGLLGTVLLGVAIVLRGVAAGRWPTANMYEFTLVGTFVVMVVLGLVQRRHPIAFVGTVVSGGAVLALVLALNAFYVKADAVQPALQSYWLIIHVGVAITATGIFTVAAAVAVLQLLRDARAAGRSRLGEPWRAMDAVRRRLHGWRVTGRRFRWLEQMPSARELEARSFRLNAVGFVLWTFTLIAGSIWAEHAWGRYWGWDPKEVGTFVAWVVYAAYLHARSTRGWSGRRAAGLVLVGYATVIANFTLVNLFVSGLHSYSGL